jgi:hypothetical protein
MAPIAGSGGAGGCQFGFSLCVPEMTQLGARVIGGVKSLARGLEPRTGATLYVTQSKPFGAEGTASTGCRRAVAVSGPDRSAGLRLKIRPNDYCRCRSAGLRGTVILDLAVCTGAGGPDRRRQNLVRGRRFRSRASRVTVLRDDAVALAWDGGSLFGWKLVFRFAPSGRGGGT